MKMNFKSFSALFVSLVFVAVLIFTAVFYNISFKNSSVMDDISIETISGDESVMENININGSIGAWNYQDFSYVESEFTEFTVDINGNLQTENTKLNLETDEYSILTAPTIFDVSFNVIIPEDAQTELLYKEYEDDYGYVGVFDTDKFIPYFQFAINNTWWDTFLVIKPDYYVECIDDTSATYSQYIYTYEDFYDEINSGEMSYSYNSYTEDLTVKIGDDYYMVLPTFDNAVGINGIYKFEMSEDYLAWVSRDYIEGSNYSYEDTIAEEEYRYEKLIDIPINIEGENNKVVRKVFEYDGKLILISTQEVSSTEDNLYLNVYDIEKGTFEDEIYLGEFDYKYLLHNTNDEFLTIQKDDTFITYELDNFSVVNQTTLEETPTPISVFYNGENLYLCNNVDTGYSDYNSSNIDFSSKNEILVYKNDELLYKGELHTNIYQDYMMSPSISGFSRTLLDFSFENKEI
ncbi:MAG: hypothetical protein R3Y35_09090 [Clostridia bacterium]